MSDAKVKLRIAARIRREQLARDVPDFARRLATHATGLKIPNASLIGAYIAMPGEAGPHILLKQLTLNDCIFAFPRVVAKDEPLEFHHWQPGRELKKSCFGVLEPSADWPIAHPRILLIPLLAFDARGYRLGYGGGFYDRTIATLKPMRTIGIAYAGQEVDAVPHDEHDIALDEVLTESGLRALGSREGAEARRKD